MCHWWCVGADGEVGWCSLRLFGIASDFSQVVWFLCNWRLEMLISSQACGRVDLQLVWSILLVLLVWSILVVFVVWSILGASLCFIPSALVGLAMCSVYPGDLSCLVYPSILAICPGWCHPGNLSCWISWLGLIGLDAFLSYYGTHEHVIWSFLTVWWSVLFILTIYPVWPINLS